MMERQKFLNIPETFLIGFLRALYRSAHAYLDGIAICKSITRGRAGARKEKPDHERVESQSGQGFDSTRHQTTRAKNINSATLDCKQNAAKD